jgi:DNA ligase-1
MKTLLPILYHEARTGKLHSWRIWTEGADMVEEYGTVDGAKTTNTRTAKAKNVGKKNETTPDDQAFKEAAAKHQKKLDKGYSTSKEKAKETVFLPMLAHDFRKLKKDIDYPVDVQPKLDGLRCLAYWKDGAVVLMSRGGKFYSVTHIEDEISYFLPKGSVLDGELYVHGMHLQDISALSKKHREPDDEEHPGGSLQLKFVVFDGFHISTTHHNWRRRGLDLFALFLNIKSKHICVCETQIDVKSRTELEKWLNYYEAEGYEGIIIRKDGPYELGHRSRNLLKWKNFIDDEFTIVGHKEAQGNDIGTVVWICETEEGKTFETRPKGKRSVRRKWLENAESHYGEKLTVRFQAWTKDKLPQFPVGLAIREDL